MKKVAAALIIIILLLLSIPAYGMPITLEQAKKLAVDNARSLKTLKQTIEQLKIKTSIAEDAYTGNDPYIGWQNTVNYLSILEADIAQLNQQLLDPALTVEEKATLQAKLADKVAMKAAQEATAAGYKAKLPTTLGTDSSLKESWDAAEDLYDDTKTSYDHAVKQMELAVEKLYYSLIYQQQTLLSMDKALEIQMANIRIAELRKELGVATELDIQSVRVNASDYAQKVQDLRASYQLSQWKLNDLIGRNLYENAELVIPAYIPASYIKDLDSVIANVMKNNVIISQKERDLKFLEKDYNDTDSSKTNDRNLLSADIEKSKLDIENKKLALKQKAKVLYDAQNTKHKAWDVATINLQKNGASFEHDRIRYKLGLISTNQYRNSEVAYLQTSADELKAAFDYRVALHELELAEQGVVDIEE